ncbi:DUF402 domain-containing protein [Arthrobacter sp. UM1]|uniref:DUF402 domain-containing protein n=1 Tax=Arthrobacter sp. UM1 TaxID=2766776 RepID=UPI001CF66A75|nr:DUF402 domain-containing protein [Arthrobacter sp. UM1]MCB4207650.1 YgaC family protein [Arthrobacter sp. UM1]
MRVSAHGPGPRPAEREALRHDVSALAAAEFGEPVIVRAWKYNGLAHYTVPGRYAGADEHGHWVRQPAGAFVARPGLGFFAGRPALCLVPHGSPWIATFHPRDSADGPDWHTYVDVSAMLRAHEFSAPTAQPGVRSRGFEVESFDMDLDVVASHTRGVFVDDEDEFLEHQRQFGYPASLVEAMEASAEAVSSAMLGNTPPFDNPSATVSSWWSRSERLETP